MVGISYQRVGRTAVDEAIAVSVPGIVLIEIGEALVLFDDYGEVLQAADDFLVNLDVDGVDPSSD